MHWLRGGSNAAARSCCAGCCCGGTDICKTRLYRDSITCKPRTDDYYPSHLERLSVLEISLALLIGLVAGLLHVLQHLLQNGVLGFTARAGDLPMSAHNLQSA